MIGTRLFRSPAYAKLERDFVELQAALEKKDQAIAKRDAEIARLEKALSRSVLKDRQLSLKV